MTPDRAGSRAGASTPCLLAAEAGLHDESAAAADAASRTALHRALDYLVPLLLALATFVISAVEYVPKRVMRLKAAAAPLKAPKARKSPAARSRPTAAVAAAAAPAKRSSSAVVPTMAALEPAAEENPAPACNNALRPRDVNAQVPVRATKALEKPQRAPAAKKAKPAGKSKRAKAVATKAPTKKAGGFFGELREFALDFGEGSFEI